MQNWMVRFGKYGFDLTVVSGVVLDGVNSLISLNTAAMVECLYAV